ncbi:MAG: hypothetical protein AMXMBFR7_51370 [Planctomycetota bacterium]
MRKTRPLLKWDRVPGFLCDWHLAGLFDPGLQHNPAPDLFQKKISLRWSEDHLQPWGGSGAIADVPAHKAGGVDWEWSLLPLNWTPELSLLRSRDDFPAWAERMNGRNPHTWDRAYFALAVVESPEDADAELWFSGWDGCRLWINGQLSFDEHSYHHVIWDMERVGFRLKQGLNSFLLQLDRDGCVARIAIPGAPQKLYAIRSVADGEAPTARKVSAFAQMRRYAANLKVTNSYDGQLPLAEWQDQFREHFLRCLGPAPERSTDLPSPKLISHTKCNGYARSRYHLAAEGDAEIPCYVLIPQKPNGRTLVVAHGHESPAKVVGEEPHTGSWRWVGKYTGNYGEQLAQRGFVVTLIHERGFGERRDYFGSSDPCNAAAELAMTIGLTLPRLHIADLHLAYDFVRTFAGVDGNRIGLTGLSGGGTLTYLTAAFDERFKAAAEFCGMCRYTRYATGLKGCGMQVVPGLFPVGDVGEVLSLIAPRPLLLVHGRLDSSFNVIEFRSIAEDTRRAYRAAGVEDRLTAEVIEMPHQYDIDAAEKFFLTWL